MSAFRFLSSQTRGVYSMWRGEIHLGFVRKVRHRWRDQIVRVGWEPWLVGEQPLPRMRTRDLAADSLWRAYQER